jgi:hypothetical protein
MRTQEQRGSVWRLAAAGLNASEIARTTDVPRSTVRGWIEADANHEPHDVCDRCGQAAHNFGEISEHDYSYLFGLYLGDGTISSGRRGVYALRISVDRRHLGVIAEAALSMGAVRPSSRVGIVRRRGCVEVRSYSKSWPCLFPQHGAGPKHKRRIELAAWQKSIVHRYPRQFVRGLLHSDGCRVTNVAVGKNGTRYEYPRYFFTNASGDILEIFCDALHRLDVRYTRPSSRNVSVARRESVELLDSFVGPKR